jgi:5S rRNA maturation endonuclease (ribonuclease M5)
MTPAIAKVRQALEARGCRGRGSSWTCPAHDDRRASLSVREGADGRALLKCHAGCSLEEVVAALGLQERDLFANDGERDDRREIATYDYVDEEGTLLFQVVRYWPKSFRQRRPDGRGGWIWNLDGTTRVLYRLPQVLEAVRSGERVYVVEGERDVHALEELGLVAATNPGGAGKWRDEYSRYLAGADVTIIADRDDAGRRHALQVARSLEGVAARVQVLEPTKGKDISEHLLFGGSLGELAPLEDGDPAPSAGRTIPASAVRPERVAWVWPDRVPAGMLTLFAGRPGEGKSTIVIDLAARVTRQGGVVIVCSAEDDPARVLRPRLEAAGADLERVHIWQAPLELPEGVEALRAEVERLGATLVVIDPLNAYIGLETNTHRDHHVRRVLAPLGELASRTGAAVVVIGHTNKAASDDPLMRVGGSIGFTAAARQVLLAATDPADEGRRVLAVVKSNVAAFPAPVAYTIEPVTLEGGITTSRIAWLGEAPEVDVRTLLAPPAREERSLALEAAGILREILAAGPRPAREAERELREALGDLSHGLIVKARQLAGVGARKAGFEGGWEWYLPEESREESRPNPSERDSSARRAETDPSGPEESRSYGGDSSVGRDPSDLPLVHPDDLEGEEREALERLMRELDAYPVEEA